MATKVLMECRVCRREFHRTRQMMNPLCSRACRNRQHVCVQCGCRFRRASRKQRACSQKCKNEASRGHRVKRRNCAWCSRVVKLTKSRFCSPQCWYAMLRMKSAIRKQQREWRRRKNHRAGLRETAWHAAARSAIQRFNSRNSSRRKTLLDRGGWRLAIDSRLGAMRYRTPAQRSRNSRRGSVEGYHSAVTKAISALKRKRIWQDMPVWKRLATNKCSNMRKRRRKWVERQRRKSVTNS